MESTADFGEWPRAIGVIWILLVIFFAAETWRDLFMLAAGRLLIRPATLGHVSPVQGRS